MLTELGRSQVGPAVPSALRPLQLRSSSASTACGSWRRAWRRVGKAEVNMEVEAEVVEEKEEEKKKEEEEEKNNSDKI